MSLLFQGVGLSTSDRSIEIRRRRWGFSLACSLFIPLFIPPAHWSGEGANTHPRRTSPPLGSGVQDTLVERVVSDISQDSITAYLWRLQDFQTRYSYTDSCRACSEWLYEKLSSYELSPQFHEYLHQGCTWVNVVGTLRGLRRPSEIVILCGHYDSISEDPYNFAPGANDNGTGTAAIVEIARVFSNYDFDRTVRFILFSGEEQGLVGSHEYAEEARAAGENIFWVFNIDMVGYMPSQPWVVDIRTDYPSEELADTFIAVGERYTSLMGNKVLMPDAPSDQRSFWEFGYQGIWGRGGGDYEAYKHTTADTIGNLDLDYLTEVTRMFAAGTLELGPIAAPVPPSPILSVVPGDRSAVLSWDETPERWESFEGYRVYRGSEPDPAWLVLIGQYDKVDGIGYDTGLEHSATDSGLLNGSPYYYAVTSYDSTPASLESDVSENLALVYPAPPSAVNLDRVAVVPNPYRPGQWESIGWGEKLQFINLPAGATIRIYSLGGDLIEAIEHRGADAGSCEWYPQSARIASGVYLYSVDTRVGSKVGKFVVIK